MSELTPLLIAKQKNAKVLKDDYKLGWLYQDETGYLWSVWGSSNSLKNALKVANEVISEKGSRKVYISETPVERGKVIYEPLPEFKEAQEELAALREGKSMSEIEQAIADLESALPFADCNGGRVNYLTPNSVKVSIAALRAQAEREAEPKPLTLQELKERIEKWVWCKGEGWGKIAERKDKNGKECLVICLLYGEWSVEEKGLKFYDREPKEETK